MSGAEKVTLGVIAFFVVMAVLTFARLLLRKNPSTWRRVRMGVFVERDERGDDEPKQG